MYVNLESKKAFLTAKTSALNLAPSERDSTLTYMHVGPFGGLKIAIKIWELHLIGLREYFFHL